MIKKIIKLLIIPTAIIMLQTSCNSVLQIQDLFNSNSNKVDEQEKQKEQELAFREYKRKTLKEGLNFRDAEVFLEGERIESERVNMIVPKGWDAVLSLNGTAVTLHREDGSAMVTAETWKPLPESKVTRKNFCDNATRGRKQKDSGFVFVKKPVLYENELSSVCITSYYSKNSSNIYYEVAEFMDTGNISIVSVNTETDVPAEVLIKSAFAQSFNTEMNINIRHALGEFTPYEKYKLVKVYDVPLFDGISK